jgi:DNA repair protein RadA
LGILTKETDRERGPLREPFQEVAKESGPSGAALPEISIEELKNEKGRKLLNSTQLRTLEEAGFRTAEDILEIATKRELSLLLTPKTAEKLWITAAETLMPRTFRSAAEIQKLRHTHVEYLTTGSRKLDELIGGGIETGSITEIAGSYGAGKTELAHQLSVNVQLPREQGGLEGSCLYFDTEKTFRPERIVEMASAAGLEPAEAVNRIIVAECYTSDHQIFLLNSSHEIIRRENIRLIVVDSLMAHFRSEYIGREVLWERQQKLNQYMARLARMARKFNLAVFVTNQAVSSPDLFGATHPTGGNIVAHSSCTRLWIRRPKAMSPLRIVRLTESPWLPVGEAVFKITSRGVEDKEEESKE